ncbi:hypothetical protein [Arthrobacter sp. JSM 101049]|uniref:hypothetical protein n=1 Tax=Arthrobacter sp. JSM 101049 TaxID=929097 RepID=UPI003561E8CD
MPWLRMGDTAANHPTVLGVLEHQDADEKLVNEVFGFVVRCAAQSTAHLTDYVVNRGTALAIGGFSRAEKLLEVAMFAGYMTVQERDLGDGQGTRTVYKIMDDPEFIHMRTREEIEWERQRKSDNSNPALIIPVRLRDGDACRYCGQVVKFAPGARTGRHVGTYDHRSPGQAATVETYVVSCKGCNSSRSDAPDADTALPLLPVPQKPYYSPATVEWIKTNDWAQRNGYKAPEPPAQPIAPGQPSGNGHTRPEAASTVEQAPKPAPVVEAPVEPSAGLPQKSAGSAGAKATGAVFTGTGRDGSGRAGTGRAGAGAQPPPQPKKKSRRRSRPRKRG